MPVQFQGTIHSIPVSDYQASSEDTLPTAERQPSNSLSFGHARSPNNSPIERILRQIITPARAPATRAPYDVVIGGTDAQRPVACNGPRVPGTSATIDKKSLGYLDRAAVNNALSGIIHVDSGKIYLYPLADEAYRSGDRDFDKNGDGYRTSRFPFARPYAYSEPDEYDCSDPLGYPSEDDHPARPLAEGKMRERSMSVSGPERKVSPIKHMDPLWGEEVSHEQMARRHGGLQINSNEGRKFGTDPIKRFIGFTAWKESDKVKLVCTSRALNTEKFNAKGNMNNEWAAYIQDGIARANVTKPKASDDGVILGLPGKNPLDPKPKPTQ